MQIHCMLTRMAALAAFATVAAWAADVTGKWSGQMSGPNGDMTIAATFKQSGTKLTGTIDGPGGEPTEIQDGKVDGDKIVFTVAFGDMKIVHEGTIRGDEMTLRIQMTGGPEGPGGGPGPITLKRMK